MKSYFVLLSLAACCFGAIDGVVNSTDGKPQHLQFENGVGKLSDGDYQQNRQALQRGSAGVLGRIEEISARLRIGPPACVANKPIRPMKAAAKVCPHCGAKVKQALKLCGECGKTVA